jgi:hypothetical protein
VGTNLASGQELARESPGAASPLYLIRWSVGDPCARNQGKDWMLAPRQFRIAFAVHPR